MSATCWENGSAWRPMMCIEPCFSTLLHPSTINQSWQQSCLEAVYWIAGAFVSFFNSMLFIFWSGRDFFSRHILYFAFFLYSFDHLFSLFLTQDDKCFYEQPLIVLLYVKLVYNEALGFQLCLIKPSLRNHEERCGSTQLIFLPAWDTQNKITSQWWCRAFCALWIIKKIDGL